jgi:hypothetical protein
LTASAHEEHGAAMMVRPARLRRARVAVALCLAIHKAISAKL